MRCYTVAARQRGRKAGNLLYKLSLALIAVNRQHGWIAVEYGITALLIYLFIYRRLANVLRLLDET